jgi:hypothetical protein
MTLHRHRSSGILAAVLLVVAALTVAGEASTTWIIMPLGAILSGVLLSALRTNRLLVPAKVQPHAEVIR